MIFVFYTDRYFSSFLKVCNHMLSCFQRTGGEKRIQRYFRKLMYNLSQSSQAAIKKLFFFFFLESKKYLIQFGLVGHIKPADVISLSS